VIGRGLMTLSRSVHEIVWGLIFVSAVGLGALAGVLAMACARSASSPRSSPRRSRTCSRADRGDPRRRRQQASGAAVRHPAAGRAGGARHVIFEWDINIRRSTIMGWSAPAASGSCCFRQMAMSNYGGISDGDLAVLLLIVLGEVVSYYARKAVI
jgi:phosphonate transport system permease protein